MQSNTPHHFYTAELERQKTALQRFTQVRNRLGWLRLGLVIITIAFASRGFSVAPLWGGLAVAFGLAFFLIAVSRDVLNNKRIAHTERLVRINEEELRVLSGDYKDRFSGESFIPIGHPYADDLDLFGRASLFQYINRCASELGQERFARNLLQALPVTEVRARQDAVKELAPETQWRQTFQATLLHTPIKKSTKGIIEDWLAGETDVFAGKGWLIFVNGYTAFTLASAVATLLGLLPFGLFSGLFGLYLVIATVLSTRASKSYTTLARIVSEIASLQHGLQCVEEKTWQAPLLQTIQQQAKTNGLPGHGEIKKLQQLLNRFDMRLNVYVFLFLNSFLLWDVRQMRGLNHWRRQNKNTVNAWFEILAEMEVLNSLATLHFNQPTWAWPQFSAQHFTWEGQEIGHPLLASNQSITNNFTLDGTGKVALITGSNMAGKSTFLRSLGVNAVLAQMGAPVCAASLRLSPAGIMSSMRIADNLAENTSTFYAELKKLKAIIEAIKTGQPLFILLDEVLRGTNSLDRHIGLEALIRQLIRKGAVAVIATHDVEVARLEQTLPGQLVNYHFDVQVAGEELYFDYRLKTGVCTSLNASLLMRKIGIELDS